MQKTSMTELPRVYGIIPARYESVRFPGKALADILGKPMVWHVYQRACRCPELNQIVLATDDVRIQQVADRLDIPVVMTRSDHKSGTDRVLEAARYLKVPRDAVVVNIQGDEPCLEPAMISELVRPFADEDVQVTTLVRKMSAAEAESPDRVKVVFASDGRALYFSRAPIPYPRQEEDSPDNANYWLHIGLYAFRMHALERFSDLSPSRLEKREKLEQLRLLENDIPIQVVKTIHTSHGVDSPEDLEAAIALLKS